MVTGRPGLKLAVWNTSEASAAASHISEASIAIRRAAAVADAVRSGRSKPTNVGSRLIPTVVSAARSRTALASGNPTTTAVLGSTIPGTAAVGVRASAIHAPARAPAATQPHHP